jgi:DNA-directed RNA polymerase subunit RPC12/RpoP
MAEKEEVVTVNEFGVDVAVRTIRGRSCPVCGGKIIPSNRAVYQSAGDPSEVFALWECERCGHSEQFVKPVETKKVHGAAAKAVAGGGKTTGVKALTGAVGVSSVEPKSESKAASRAAARRAMPPDVKKMLEVMNRTAPKVEE